MFSPFLLNEWMYLWEIWNYKKKKKKVIFKENKIKKILQNNFTRLHNKLINETLIQVERPSNDLQQRQIVYPTANRLDRGYIITFQARIEHQFGRDLIRFSELRYTAEQGINMELTTWRVRRRKWKPEIVINDWVSIIEVKGGWHVGFRSFDVDELGKGFEEINLWDELVHRGCCTSSVDTQLEIWDVFLLMNSRHWKMHEIVKNTRGN